MSLAKKRSKLRSSLALQSLARSRTCKVLRLEYLEDCRL
jgi:hypothetical protein